MSQLPFEQYLMIFKLIKTEQQYSAVLTQASPRDLTPSILQQLLKQEKGISHLWTGCNMFISYRDALDCVPSLEPYYPI